MYDAESGCVEDTGSLRLWLDKKCNLWRLPLGASLVKLV